MSYRLGENSKLYYSTTLATSTTVSVASTIAANIKNVKIVAKTDAPEYTTRNNNGIKQYATSLADMSVTFDHKYPAAGATDVSFTAFRDAYINKTEIAVWALNDASTVTGSEGPAGNFVVSAFDRDESNGAVMFANVELKPSTFNVWHIST